MSLCYTSCLFHFSKVLIAPTSFSWPKPVSLCVRSICFVRASVPWLCLLWFRQLFSFFHISYCIFGFLLWFSVSLSAPLLLSCFEFSFLNHWNLLSAYGLACLVSYVFWSLTKQNVIQSHHLLGMWLFPHHPWWHRWGYWAENLPEGLAPHPAVSWSAGA